MPHSRLTASAGAVLLVATVLITAGGTSALGQTTRAPVERISVGPDGQQPNASSGLTGVTTTNRDGSRIVFISQATNLGASSPGIYVRDRTTRQTHFLGKAGGGRANADPVMSDDGSIVVFNSETCGGLCFVRLGEGSTPGQLEAFEDADGENFYAPYPGISGDGQRVVFHAPDDHSFVPLEDGTTFNDVGNVVYTRPGSNDYEYVHAFFDPDGDPGRRECNVNYAPKVSFDGRFVAFNGPSELSGFRVCGEESVWVKDLQGGDPVKASVVSDDPSAPNVRHIGFDLSGDGRTLAFSGTGVVVTQVFVRDLEARTTTSASVDRSGAPMEGASRGPSLNDDGSLVAFYNSLPGDIYLRDLQEGRTVRLTRTNNSAGPDLTPDGTKVAFISTASLVEGDTNEAADVFLMDLSRDVVVNSVGDRPDASDSDGRCDTGRKVSGEAECTLRAAIQQANAEPDETEITFDIEGSAPYTIKEDSLPRISRPVVIDGTTQPGFEDVPVVRVQNRFEISGRLDFDQTCRREDYNGFTLDADNSVIRGLHIDGWKCGVWIREAKGNVIEGNHIGRRSRNTVAGIEITGGSRNVIGGSTPEARNLISNNLYGIAIYDSKDNRIFGNYIGTDEEGMSGAHNEVGVRIVRSSNNWIGGRRDDLGVCRAPCNLISGNRRVGIWISGNPQGGRSSNLVTGNVIGLNVNGSAAIEIFNSFPEDSAGVFIDRSAGNFIGGSASGEGNVIAGNRAQGILIFGQLLDHLADNLIQGNWIGANPQGTAFGNTENGILISGTVERTQIGGLSGAAQTGRCDGSCNVIASNGLNGIKVSSRNDSVVQVEGNIIRANAQRALPDRKQFLAGIALFGARGSTIGGLDPAAGNLITENNGHGIAFLSVTDWVHVVGNSIFNNAVLGIALEWSSTPRSIDLNDATRGLGEAKQNAPLIESVTTTRGKTVVTGTLYSRPDAYRIDFYANVECDPSGAGEGALPVGSTTVTINSGNKASFTAELAGVADADPILTATATRALNRPTQTTSEFSRCFPATVRTSLRSGTPAGSTTLDVEDNAGFETGDRIQINPGGTNTEQATVSGMGSLILEAPVQFDHSADEEVVKFDDGVSASVEPLLSATAKPGKRVVVKGELSPGFPGGPVLVRLERQRGRQWKVGRRGTAFLGEVVDRSGEPASPYSVRLKPISGRRCRVTVVWPGSASLSRTTTRTRPFRC